MPVAQLHELKKSLTLRCCQRARSQVRSTGIKANLIDQMMLTKLAARAPTCKNWCMHNACAPDCFLFTHSGKWFPATHPNFIRCMYPCAPFQYISYFNRTLPNHLAIQDTELLSRFNLNICPEKFTI